MAYHSQSDGQMERTNQTMEQYLRVYCNYNQDDWSQLLPLAEFVYNNAKSAFMGTSPFYANYGYHPRATLKILPDQRQGNPTAETFINHIRWVYEELRRTLEWGQAKYKKEFDKNAAPAPGFKVGDLVWLNRCNIETTRPSQKLDQKRLGPFEIVGVVEESKVAFELRIPAHWRIHPVFHVSLLDSYRANKIDGREQPPLPPPDIMNGELQYEVEAVLDSRIRRNKLEYLVEWKGYGPEERTWEPAENLENAKEAIAAFHLRHPNRPSATDLKDPRPRRSLAHRSGGTVMNDREPCEDPTRTGGHPEFRSDPVGPREDRGPSGVQVRPGGRTKGRPV